MLYVYVFCCLYVCTSICLYVHMGICICVYTYICLYVYACVCPYFYLILCFYVFLYKRMFVHVKIFVELHIYPCFLVGILYLQTYVSFPRSQAVYSSCCHSLYTWVLFIVNFLLCHVFDYTYCMLMYIHLHRMYIHIHMHRCSCSSAEREANKQCCKYNVCRSPGRLNQSAT